MRISDCSSDVCSSDLSLDPLNEHAAVPAAVKDRNFARSRQPLPEAPEEMACLFLRARRADRPHLEISRVELRGQPLDHPALARRIPAFEHDDAALAVGDMRRLGALEPFLERHQNVATMPVIFGAVFIVGGFY